MTEATAARLSPEVKIDNFAFIPGTNKVKPGEEATWTSRDDNSHSVDRGQGKLTFAAPPLH